MRIISGIYKRRRFEVPRSFKARPTTDFAKEGLFNILANNYVDFEDGLTALDLFAGTGSITVELLSRGCEKVVSIEKERAHYMFIAKVLKELGTTKCIPICGDAFKYIHGKSKEQFDFIFADPPYDLPALETIPDLILTGNLLKEDGVLVLEHGKNHNFDSHIRFVEKRSYGSVNFSFFR